MAMRRGTPAAPLALSWRFVVLFLSWSAFLARTWASLAASALLKAHWRLAPADLGLLPLLFLVPLSRAPDPPPIPSRAWLLAARLLYGPDAERNTDR